MKRNILSLLALFSGCVGIPDHVEAVRGFDLNRYLGTWYEIARLDHSFERGLERVSATYSMREDGGIRVLNKGFNSSKNEWKESEGKAYFVEGPELGRLKVSFFGPFYGGYNIIELDQASYQYSMVCGPDLSYLWILSRSPQMDAALRTRLVEKARSLGFGTGKLIFVKQ